MDSESVDLWPPMDSEPVDLLLEANAKTMWRLRVLLLEAELHHMVSFFNQDKEEMETVLVCALNDDRVL